jgi:hypothetical protein
MQLTRPLTTMSGVRSRFVFPVEVPPLGYRVYRVRLGSLEGEALACSGTRLENEHLLLEIDRATGRIARLVLKSTGADLAAPGAKHAVVIDDPSDTWGHAVERFDREIGEFECVSAKLLECGPVRAILRVESRYGASTLREDYVLAADAAYVDVRVALDWHEQLKMLKLRYVVARQIVREAAQLGLVAQVEAVAPVGVHQAVVELLVPPGVAGELGESQRLHGVRHDGRVRVVHEAVALEPLPHRVVHPRPVARDQPLTRQPVGRVLRVEVEGKPGDVGVEPAPKPLGQRLADPAEGSDVVRPDEDFVRSHIRTVSAYEVDARTRPRALARVRARNLRPWVGPSLLPRQSMLSRRCAVSVPCVCRFCEKIAARGAEPGGRGAPARPQTSNASRSSIVSRRRITRASPSRTSTAAGRGTAL